MIVKPYMVMGIVNITDDSFYEGGRHTDTGAAVDYALKLAAEGADIIDVGGASSRPGSKPLPAEEEAARVVPVIDGIMKRGVCVPISVDTTWSAVAVGAIGAGATWVNDISAGRFDPRMPEIAMRSGCMVVLTHSRGDPDTLHDAPGYGADIANEVINELMPPVNTFLQAGVDKNKIILDPGFGFAKDVRHNIELLRGIGALTQLGFTVMAGLSRKSFIGAITDRLVSERLGGTLAATAAAYARGVRIFRVHDVRETADFLKVLNAIGF
ncbi:MAG: dihydropteroate synthase [Chitinispirillia bacterium]|nr:dihydropteroate synthase [Chitinispirillia bacterium]MCL2242052.1 dihydropteroate synthase [Chitinispirillia bacterium]